MSQMDLGSSVLARQRAKGRVATVAVEAMTFYQPVWVGDIVSIHGEMTREGKTSMAIHIEVWVTRHIMVNRRFIVSNRYNMTRF